MGQNNAVQQVAPLSGAAGVFQGARPPTNYARQSVLGNLLVKTGSGTLHGGVCAIAGSSDCTVEAYDGIDNTGTPIMKASLAIQGQYFFPEAIAFTKGLYLVMAGTTAADLTVLYN